MFPDDVEPASMQKHGGYQCGPVKVKGNQSVLRDELVLQIMWQSHLVKEAQDIYGDDQKGHRGRRFAEE